MKLSCSAKKKQPPPDPSPEAGRGRPRGRPRGRSCGRPRGRCRGRCRGRPRGGPRGGPRGTGRQTLQNLPQQAPQGQTSSIGFQSCRLPARKHSPPKPSKTLQTPSPTGTPGPRPLLNQAPQGQGHSNGFLLAFKAAVCQPANTPNAPKPSKRSKTNTPNTLQNPPNTIQNPPNPPGLEACFEQVAQGLWLVRRVHRRSKTISLPGRLELPTLRLTASRSNQLSYGSLCRRPKLVPVLEKRLNNSWLQMVCQTKGQQPK